ncbi:Cna B-type domain-containing protein [Bacillus clarus]|uniref:Cna B-type domain-containing protein n=1 Tax=Bacillus clarus TaxID=2338372 RepID=A0A090YT01_9BACI|nr:Cna B-type domain-containing protein [Bacillus clarus]KFN01989.1 LPXTG cell wall anchor domain protein [Bacillus clarus]RFT67445.1 Cna B-type domain-containing protein [Bacillus clarus]
MYLKRITSIFSIIMIFMFIIGQSLLPIIANAQELNTAGLVDSFQIGKTNLSTTERTKVTVNFSEKNGLRLKPGDILTLTLPPELKGLDREFPLDDYGTCKVTAGTVVCTFNDKVSTHQNIKGYLNFFVEAANVGTDEKKEIETNFGTNVDKQSVTITGPSSGGGTDPGKSPFFYKTGDMNSGKDNEVRWFLNINLNKEELSRDIVVTDNLQEGQTLNKDSFYIIVDDYLGRRSLTLQEFEKQGYGTITFTDDRSFKVVLYKDKARLASFSIGYTSTITEAGKKQEFFKNDYTIDYQVLNKDPVIESGSYPVENMTAGGGAEGNVVPKGTLKIVKHIEGDKEKVIPNVSFKLYKESGEQVGDVYKTDEKGIIEIPNLQPGKYYVQEVSAPDYVDFDPQVKVSFEVKSGSANGIELPIPNKMKTTSVTGTKTWKGDNAKDRPTMIKVDLLQNGKVIATQEVTEVTGWKYEFKDLAAYDTDGNAYKYEVKEQAVDGYQTEVKGYDITNTKVVQTTKVGGTKTWKDDNAKDRPTMIKVDLLQNGKVIATQEVTEASGWKYEFKDLEVHDAEGKAYKYEVKEQAVDGYQSEVKGNDITNTKVGKTKVEGTKTWKDDNAKDRPKMIKVDLLQNDKVIATQEVTEASGWKYEFKDLAAYDANGVAYKYEVKEQAVNGYQSEVKGYDITNTKVGETKVEGTKTWNDNNATDRPSTIKVDLLQNGKVVDTKEVSKATNWKYTFDKLQAYDANGVAYKYEVKEQAVDGYKSEVKGNDITNTKVGETKVEGTKTWNDNNATDRPSTIKVDLLQNGKVVDTKEVSKATNWKYTFDKLQAYDANGVAYKYEVKEQAVDGYQSEVKGNDITNTKVGQTKVEGTKTWKDDNAKDRPKMIKVDLLQNGQVIATQEVSTASGWKYEFKDLAAYDAEGKAYKYEVKEQAVDGYQSEVKGNDITNTKVGKTKVEGAKIWKDGNGEGRPETIKVDLLQNSQVIATQEVSAASDWKYEFKDLAAYDANGVAYKYEVKEQPVDGYQTEVKGNDITNTKVSKTKVEGTKTWNDNNAKDRPSTIKVDLLQNGKVVDTKEVSKATNWKYTFENLQAYDANGVAYKYEVKEQAVDGYKSEVKGNDITNTKVGKTKVEGTKTWKDGNATDRPVMIKVDLLQNGNVIKTQDVQAVMGWKYIFVDLEAYDANGVAYEYTVKEQPVKGYQTEVKGNDITNTKVGETKVEGTKTWNDNNATDRPSTIKVDLLQNGKVVDTKEVSKATNWKYTFDKLQAYDANGVAYKYEVKEQPVDGYKSEVKGNDITNTKVGETKVEGTKTWNDNNATDRPKMIKVDLLQNGKVVDTKEVTAATNWKYTFDKLQVYDANGVAYKYEVKEQPVDGYKSEVKGNDITNTKVGETKVEGTKTWKDDNAKDRPKMIKVDLLQNGQVIATKEVSEATGWKYAFTDLVAYDAEGKAYKYEVKEQAVDGYQSEVKGNDITNTKIKDGTGIDPKDPSTDPKDPNTNTDTNNDSKVPPTKENDKATPLLPKTGGTTADMISIVGGMILFVLGGILFFRQRIK